MADGTRLGPYEILAPIGAGGMGEVYRARDTKLNRDVAIKVLPAALANDADYMARFQREAQVLASLNHPNIAAIYGFEDHAIVMELVEGPTLAERIAREPVPVEEALPIAKQIAEALEAAHEKSVIHRDLKPGNIKITPDGLVKVLDFGLAKTADAQPISDASNSPTLTIRATETGLILGTAAYMSPEQAAGKPVDQRADIWSFGVVLWETLTGKCLFDGETVSHTLAHVLTAPIDFDQLPAHTPVVIRDLLRRCLDRDIRMRLRDIGEARVALHKYLANPKEEATVASMSVRRRTWIPWSAAGAFALAFAALSVVHFREKPPQAQPMRFRISLPEKQSLASPAIVSPDGRWVAFAATDSTDHRRLWVRAIDALDARPVADMIGSLIFWSPDSRFLAYSAPDFKLRKISPSGGPSIVVCDIGNDGGGSWSREGVILIAGRNGISRVSADGGVPSLVTPLDHLRQETGQGYPGFLPDGRHFIFLRAYARSEENGIYISSLDAKPDSPSKLLAASQFAGEFVPSEDLKVGYLLYLRGNTLVAQRLDLLRLELTGEAVPIAETNLVANGGQAAFSGSTGVLTYIEGTLDETQLTWYDRSGKILDKLGEPGQYTDLALAPDETRMIFERTDPLNRKNDLWLFDGARRVSTRFTFHPGQDSHPVWSPDGAQVAFVSTRDGPGNLYQKAANGAANEEVLLKSKQRETPYDWSHDGRFIMYSVNPGTANVRNVSMFVLPLMGDRHPLPYLANEFANGQGAFSPDTHWVAYRSNESGENEIYVQAFPNSVSAGKWRVSSGGGLEPHWRKDGRELFYMSGRKMMAVDIATTPSVKLGVPKVLFEAPFWFGGGTVSRHYAVSGDGQRFLINANTETPGTSPITVVLNWAAALDK